MSEHQTKAPRWSVPADAGFAAVLEKSRGPMNLARALGLTGPAVAHWRRVPGHHVVRVAALYGISRHVIRPDLYPEDGPPEAKTEAAA